MPTDKTESMFSLSYRVAVDVPAAPDKVFAAPSRMVWQDGFAPMFRGRRTFTVTPRGDGARAK